MSFHPADRESYCGNATIRIRFNDYRADIAAERRGPTRPGTAKTGTHIHIGHVQQLVVAPGLLLVQGECPPAVWRASKRMMKGGLKPGGNMACIRLAKALTSAAACAILVRIKIDLQQRQPGNVLVSILFTPFTKSRILMYLLAEKASHLGEV